MEKDKPYQFSYRCVVLQCIHGVVHMYMHIPILQDVIFHAMYCSFVSSQIYSQYPGGMEGGGYKEMDS